MAYPTVAPANFTTVECHKQVRSWRLLRSFIELLIQTCTCTLIQNQEFNDEIHLIRRYNTTTNHHRHFPATTNVTGTIFGSRAGKVHFCIQTNPKSQTPILLLELAIPTTFLAREMRGGTLRIALECSNNSSQNKSLLNMPVWTMFCNGKRVGFAFKRQPLMTDFKILKRMETVDVGAGVVAGKEVEQEEDIMYLRGNFKRVTGKSVVRSETFHLIEPDHNVGQELSIFFFQSR